MIIVNGKRIEFTEFPNNEIKLGLADLSGARLTNGNDILVFNITLKYEDDKDLIRLMFVRKLLEQYTPKNSKVNLEILYMPYSRMDREENKFLFTLKYVAEFINSLNFDKVTVYEPHSDVTPALLNNCKSLYPVLDIVEIMLADIEFDKDVDYVFFPDAGAQKRYSKMFDTFKQIVGFKQRDFTTGRINKLDVLGDIDTKDFKVVIVDDLCSKGGTFMLSAGKLREVGAKEVYLAVTHCENSIYEGDIFKTNMINKVFTTDSILTMFDPELLDNRLYVQNIAYRTQ